MVVSRSMKLALLTVLPIVILLLLPELKIILVVWFTHPQLGKGNENCFTGCEEFTVMISGNELIVDIASEFFPWLVLYTSNLVFMAIRLTSDIQQSVCLSFLHIWAHFLCWFDLSLAS
jgi:hypothetical protein